jgi:hypothetical protein
VAEGRVNTKQGFENLGGTSTRRMSGLSSHLGSLSAMDMEVSLDIGISSCIYGGRYEGVLGISN